MSEPEAEEFSFVIAPLFQAASQFLNWTPDTFWSATPREFSDAISPLVERGAGLPPSSEEISAMIKRDQNG